MRAIQKLVRHGNSTHVAIPRPLLINLGWLPGEFVILELLEDGSVRLRRPQAEDLAPVRVPRLQTDSAAAVKQ